MYRYDIANYLIEKFGFKRYLEIGIFNGECIKKIKCNHKDGVDSGIEGKITEDANYQMTSDDFFEKIAPSVDKYDIVLIDGLHHSEQVELDIQNALKYTIDNGIILLHDCNPPTLGHASRPRSQQSWNGDVYKAILNFQKTNVTHNYFTLNTDWGIGVIIKNKPPEKKENVDFDLGISSWEYFNENRNRLLNLKDPSYIYACFEINETRPILEVFTTSYNEAQTVEELINFYQKRVPSCIINVQDNMSTDNTLEICNKYKNVNFSTFDTNGKMSEIKLMELRNNSWKKSHAKYIIVCDSDELVDVSEEDLLDNDINEKWTVCKCNGIELFDTKPFSDENIYGVNSDGYSKSILFYKDAISNMNFYSGSHTCNPIPNDGFEIKYSLKRYNLYHTKWQNFEYGLKRQNEIKEKGLSQDTPRGWNFHYALPVSEHEKYFNKGYNNRIKIDYKWSN